MNEERVYTKVRYVVAPTIYRLEVLVNAFLRSDEGRYFALDGEPQVFGHEEYVQAFSKFEHGASTP